MEPVVCLGFQEDDVPIKPVENIVAATSGAKRGRWGKDELARLLEAVESTPTLTANYWEAVARKVGGRSGKSCCKAFNDRSDLQKSAHCHKVLNLFQKRPNAKQLQQRREQVKVRWTTDDISVHGFSMKSSEKAAIHDDSALSLPWNTSLSNVSSGGQAFSNKNTSFESMNSEASPLNTARPKALANIVISGIIDTSKNRKRHSLESFMQTKIRPADFGQNLNNLETQNLYLNSNAFDKSNTDSPSLSLSSTDSSRMTMY